MNSENTVTISKIAKVTLVFWIIKIIATTLGETTGDFIAQTLNLGYIFGIVFTGILLVVLLFLQIRATKYNPALFWAAIVGTTTAGTEISDFLDRTLNIGYLGGSILLGLGLFATLFIWYRREGHLKVENITRKNVEIMFWTAVLFSNSLGTAFGDWLVDGLGLSFFGGALVCIAVIVAVLVAHYTKAMNAVALFWIAFVFTRPFGATFGDLLTKPVAHGGFNLGTYNASLVCFVMIATLVMFNMRQRRKAEAR